MLIQYDPPAGVIERWQPELLSRFGHPTEEGYSWLLLVWEPGDPWCPVERWVIWEMTPPHRAPLDIYDELRGPNPRAFNFFDSVKGHFVTNRVFAINRHQWVIHQRTGFFGVPLWVIQGTKGGHKRRYSDVESQCSHANGGPRHPPAPGDLCYAVPDERTMVRLEQLRAMHELHYGDTLRLLAHEYTLKNHLDIGHSRIARQMAEQMWNFLGEQIEDSLPITHKAEQDFWDNYADPDAPHPDFEKGTEEWLESVAADASL